MAPAPNRLRIIGGLHRGRVVHFAGVPGLRPTPDRVRETLFNWLGQDLAGRATLEPYAGSGVLSLEALSRGASAAVAIDQSAAAIGRLRETADAMRIGALETHVGDAIAALTRETRRFDVIFLDPPFATDPWPRLLPLCVPRLADGGFIYAESAGPLPVPAELALHRQGKAGRVHYHLLRSAT